MNRAVEKVATLDLSSVARRVAQKYGWAPSRITAAEEQYRAFLRDAAINPKNASVPPGDADDFWHQHIIDTPKYAADCRKVFDGGFLHHIPSEDDDTCDNMVEMPVACARTCTKQLHQGPTAL